ncbi:glucose-6-phosphate dehydrogenase assembly protein OpcA [Salana multivorans]
MLRAGSTRAASSSSPPTRRPPCGRAGRGDPGRCRCRASEVVVMNRAAGAACDPDSLVTPLLLPDTPIVAWAGHPPADPSRDPLGAIVQRRITDSAMCSDSLGHLRPRAHTPGDTDLAWARATLWRGLLASALDDLARAGLVTLTGNLGSPSIALNRPYRLRGRAGCRGHGRDPRDVPTGRPCSSARPARASSLHITEPTGVTHRAAAAALGRGRLIEDSAPAGRGRRLRRGPHPGVARGAGNGAREAAS